ncbi:MAG: RNA-binding protein [Nitrososphaerota archaeon]
MSSQLALPLCTSCNRPIRPKSLAIKFYCPNCKQVLIWRCEVCRKLMRTYKCINCLFEGP